MRVLPPPHSRPRYAARMLTVRRRPCSSCPYRVDTPSGVWDAAEYDKLPAYDGDVPEQLENGAMKVFRCHSALDYVCAGWAGCHDMRNNLAVRLHWRDVDPGVIDYVSPVRLFASGKEAADHGKRDIANPGLRAKAKIRQLLILRTRRGR